MKYIGEKCPVCNNTFAEGEDIVVCPECGTPFHRECWEKTNRCINEDKHGEFTWSPDITVEPIVSDDSTISKLCPSCSARNDENATTCKNCGEPLEEEYDFSVYQQHSNSIQHIEAHRILREMNASPITRYVQQNHEKYVKKFEKIDKKKPTFNWAAFLFNPYWFFYRKLYYVGGIFIGIQLLITVLLTFIMNRLGLTEIMVAYMEATSTGSVEAIQAALLSIEPHMTELIILWLVALLPNIIVGFSADRIYKRKAFKDIKNIESAGEIDNLLAYAKYGAGVSIFSAVLSYFGYNVLTSVLSMFL